MKTRRYLLTLLPLLLTASAFSAAQEARRAVPLKDVLEQVGKYVDTYGEQLSAVVAREEYVQRATITEAGSFVNATDARRDGSRTLRSEFALVKVGGHAAGWEGFRDVYEVDGQPVHDRKDRLERLFIDSPQEALQQARTIADEGARFNIGPVARNFNTPTTALFFLHPSNQPRFRFTEAPEAALGGRQVAVIRFEEREKPTMIRTADRKNVPATGRVWVDRDTGRVLRTELQLSGFAQGTDASKATVSVDYGFEESLQLWVPVEMREAYFVMRGSRRPVGPGELPAWATGDGFAPGGISSETKCVATYSNYRRFTTDARLVIPK